MFKFSMLPITALATACLLTFAFNPIVSADDWGQWLGPKRNSVWTEKGVIKSIPETGLKELWRTPISSGFSGPAVFGDRVFVTDFVPGGETEPFDPGKRTSISGKERMLCLDRDTGKQVWEKSHPCQYNMSYALGPRVTPTVDGDRVYNLGAEGHLYCFNAPDGNVIWKKDLKAEYNLKEGPMWGFSAHPLIHGDKLFCLVGGEDSAAVAFDKMTGKEIWRSLSAKKQGYCPPTIVEAGGTEQLLFFLPKSLNSLNPETGELHWSIKIEPAYDMSIIAPAMYDDYLLVTALQNATVLLKLDSEKPSVTEIWRGKGVNPDHNPPVIHDGHIYGVDVKGHLRCIELVSGERKWESLATCPNGRPASSTTGFLVRNDDYWYITTEQGELIIAQLNPEGYKELGRAKMVDPTSENWGRKIVWSHPAFANKCVFMRNDKEIVCYSLAE